MSIKFNNDNIEEPGLYLGANFKKRELNGRTMWTVTSQEYIDNAIKNLENQLNKKGIKLTGYYGTAMDMGYQPEVYFYPELNQDGITTFQE